jgi:acyl carrier protein
MVPSAFVVLDRLPLTPSGKLDRRSLPPPDAEVHESDSYEAPRGEVEAEIAAIWRKLLHIERVGRHDNFLDLGGHSLLATRVVSHINKALDVTLSVALIFERPTVRELAQAVLQEIETELAMEAP